MTTKILSTTLLFFALLYQSYGQTNDAISEKLTEDLEGVSIPSKISHPFLKPLLVLLC